MSGRRTPPHGSGAGKTQHPGPHGTVELNRLDLNLQKRSVLISHLSYFLFDVMPNG